MGNFRFHGIWILALAAAACDSSGGGSYNAELTMDPASPVIINTPFARKTGKVDEAGNAETETVGASWFLAEYQIKNNGSSTITIISAALTLQLPSDGTSANSEGKCELTADESTLGRAYIAEVPSLGTKSLGRWYCSDLGFPKDNFVASGKIEVFGWIGDAQHPTARLKISEKTFTTQ